MKRLACLFRHRGPIVHLAPNRDHCRACRASWTPKADAPPLSLPAAMWRTFWVTMLLGFALWAVLALLASLRP